MKRLLSLFVLFLSVIANAQVENAVPSRPSPPKLVNDFTKTMTGEQIQALEQKLDAYDDSTSSQIAIVVVDDLKGYEASDYAVALGRKWGLGGKEFNNGVVILVSTGGGAGHRAAFIATGYGLEGAIPDATAKAIVDNDLIPNLKNNDFYRAFDDATDDIIKAASGRYAAPEGYHKKGKGFSIGGIIFLIIILSIFLGSRGGNNGGMMSRRGYGGFWTGLFLGNMLGGGRSGGGGGWSGGGGGGFGGFGGGSFGGGGAGGSW